MFLLKRTQQEHTQFDITFNGEPVSPTQYPLRPTPSRTAYPTGATSEFNAYDIVKEGLKICLICLQNSEWI